MATNTSATGGPLQPLAQPAPLEGKALLQFLQNFVVGITGLPGNMVRPRWQAEPPNIPAAGTAWAAIGITNRTTDNFPFVGHASAGDGSDTLQRHEQFDMLCSFYDTGADGEADAYAALLRDGLAIAQNREPLQVANMGLISVGQLTAVPSLLKQRWLYRVDLTVSIRRQIVRTYPVENLLSAPITVSTETDSITVTASPPSA